MTDTLHCPFCLEIAKFVNITGKDTQTFRCTVCTKFFLVNTADVVEEERPQIYEMLSNEGVTPIDV